MSRISEHETDVQWFEFIFTRMPVVRRCPECASPFKSLIKFRLELYSLFVGLYVFDSFGEIRRLGALGAVGGLLV